MRKKSKPGPLIPKPCRWPIKREPKILDIPGCCLLGDHPGNAPAGNHRSERHGYIDQGLEGGNRRFRDVLGGPALGVSVPDIDGWDYGVETNTLVKMAE